jgi:VanZ family protein
VQHLLVYLALGLIPAAAMQRAGAVVVALTGAAVLGGLLELAQARIPGRACEWSDLAVNLVGLGCGLLAGVLLRGWVIPEPVAPADEGKR